MSRSFRFLPVLALLCSNVFALAQAPDYARDPHQAIDESYTAAIRKYTTAPEFNSPLTDYLPASKSVPTPAKVLGDVSGAPNIYTVVSQPTRASRRKSAWAFSMVFPARN